MAGKKTKDDRPMLIHRQVAELQPYARNSRTHSKEQVAQIAASIQEFGFLNPVLVDAGGQIIAGHGRVLAAQQLGLAEVPCLLVEGLSEAQIRAYVIADNKLAENAGWDNSLLAGELVELRDGGFDLDLLGFSLDEMALLMPELPGEGLTDPDEVPDLPEEPVSKLGDIWQLGDHRLMCGDSTDVYAVAALLGDGPAPHLMVTDPPYGVEYDASWRDGIRLNSGPGTAKGKVMNDNQADWRAAWALFPGDVVYVWHAGNFAHVVAESLLACKFQIRAQIIWVKSQLVISRGHYHSQHEPCWHAVRKGKTGHWRGGRKQATVWREAMSSLRPDERLFVRHDEGGHCMPCLAMSRPFGRSLNR